MSRSARTPNAIPQKGRSGYEPGLPNDESPTARHRGNFVHMLALAINGKSRTHSLV